MPIEVSSSSPIPVELPSIEVKPANCSPSLKDQLKCIQWEKVKSASVKSFQSLRHSWQNIDLILLTLSGVLCLVVGLTLVNVIAFAALGIYALAHRIGKNRKKYDQTVLKREYDEAERCLTEIQKSCQESLATVNELQRGMKLRNHVGHICPKLKFFKEDIENKRFMKLDLSIEDTAPLEKLISYKDSFPQDPYTLDEVASSFDKYKTDYITYLKDVTFWLERQLSNLQNKYPKLQIPKKDEG